jgi:hypothetical protein
MSSLVATTDGIDALIDAVETRLTSDTVLALTLSEGLHLGSPLTDPRFLADSTCSATRIKSVPVVPGRERGEVGVDDTVEIDLCWTVQGTTKAERRTARQSAQQKAERVGEIMTERVDSSSYPARWNPRILEVRERLVLWTEGHADFIVITLDMRFRRSEKRGR